MTNIVYILIDDMGWRDLACYGSTYYETPYIDELAKQGMLFDNAYAACPVCSPTRASIMSGKYPARVKVTDWIGASAKGKLIDAPYVDHLPLEEKSLATSLREHGYATWHVGKWHLGTSDYYPDKHGFDVNIGGNHKGHPHNGYFSPYQLENLEEGPEGEYLTDRLTEESINLIRNRDKTKPFFLNLWHYTVHTPIQAKDDDIEYFKNKAKKLGLDNQPALIEGEHFPCEHKKNEKVTRRILQSDPVYAAMIYNLDWNIGRIMKTLEEEGILQDTIVIFTSDNGGLSSAEGSPTCNAPLSEGKGWMYDGGVREPLIVCWKGTVSPSSVSHRLVSSPDFYPTLVEVAGGQSMPEQHVDGESFYETLIGVEKQREKPIFWHYPHYGNQGGRPYSAVRHGKYKLIYFYESESYELFDVVSDIGETTDLAEEYPTIAEKLLAKLKEWLADVKGEIPVKNPDYQ
ncbi:sulfatase [Niameybacter massiliensis]|uniref:Sulfatase n=1 Tax=Holtiella tumoricola TaxID=3018743 RepID=A0AA42DTU1_9FIRM|nr:sulfatase [Holtiella tumoricola]MDA3733944.1 sulfatase [Holtiella tumoricola]